MRNKCFKSGKTSFPNFLCLEIGRSRNTPDEYIILTRCVYREWRRNGCERGLKRVINRGRQGRRVVEGNGGATGRKVKERVTQCHCEFVTTLSVLPFFVFYARLLLELVCTRGMKPLDACRLHTYLPFFNPRRAASLLLASSLLLPSLPSSIEIFE